MSETRHRTENPSPEIVFQEIYLPDEGDFGTGTLTFKVKKNTLIPPADFSPKGIAAIAINPPHFQITVSVNVGTKEIPVLLGRADGSNPIAALIYLLPQHLDTKQTHIFEATFRNWQIVSLSMDRQNLAQKN